MENSPEHECHKNFRGVLDSSIRSIYGALEHNSYLAVLKCQIGWENFKSCLISWISKLVGARGH